MRVSDNIRFFAVSSTLATLGSQQAEAARQASTGRRVTTPSSDPVAAADVVRIRSALEQAAAHRAALTSVRSDAELAEGMLAEGASLLVRAHEIAVQGANGALGAGERAMLATEVRSLKEQLVSIANAKGARGYVFAGTATGTPAFDASGTFLGNAFDQNVPVSPGVTTRVNVSGALAFTSSGGGRDVFADLDALETALATDDPVATAATLGSLMASREQLVRSRADAGLLIERFDTTDATLQQLELVKTSRDAAVGGADPFEALSTLTRVGQSLEQAISVARNTLNNSILRF